MPLISLLSTRRKLLIVNLCSGLYFQWHEIVKMENFDQEMFEIDQQLRSLEEYDTSSDSDVDDAEEVEDDHNSQQPEQQNAFARYDPSILTAVYFMN